MCLRGTHTLKHTFVYHTCSSDFEQQWATNTLQRAATVATVTSHCCLSSSLLSWRAEQCDSDVLMLVLLQPLTIILNTKYKTALIVLTVKMSQNLFYWTRDIYHWSVCDCLLEHFSTIFQIIYSLISELNLFKWSSNQQSASYVKSVSYVSCCVNTEGY